MVEQPTHKISFTGRRVPLTEAEVAEQLQVWYPGKAQRIAEKLQELRQQRKALFPELDWRWIKSQQVGDTLEQERLKLLAQTLRDYPQTYLATLEALPDEEAVRLHSIEWPPLDIEPEV